jgi:hypothetical protein
VVLTEVKIFSRVEANAVVAHIVGLEQQVGSITLIAVEEQRI